MYKSQMQIIAKPIKMDKLVQAVNGKSIPFDKNGNPTPIITAVLIEVKNPRSV